MGKLLGYNARKQKFSNCFISFTLVLTSFLIGRDDPELDKMLKDRLRWGDPMAHLVKVVHQVTNVSVEKIRFKRIDLMSFPFL